MYIAEDKNGNRIYATKSISKEEQYYCPVCKGEVRLKVGSINEPHFAHVSLEQCLDDFSNDMSEWHREWQMLFPERNREVVIPYNGEIHRADVLCYGTVIEFQHSPISETEFWRRNEFYTSAGFKLLWIFDLTEFDSDYDSSDRLSYIDDYSNEWGTGSKYRWKHPWRFLRNFMPQDEKEIDILFQMIPLGENPKRDDADCSLQKVTWVNSYYKTSWGYFHTSDEVVNYYELLRWLEKRRNKKGEHYGRKES